MKQIQLSVEKAKALFGKNPELDEILKENFSEEELGLKKPLPKSWFDLEVVDGYAITEIESKLRYYMDMTAGSENINLFVTEEQAKSALAYAQLTQVMKAYNGDWVPDWKDVWQDKYVIDRIKGHTFSFLAFPTEELRDEFLKNFEPLIKTFYQI